MPIFLENITLPRTKIVGASITGIAPYTSIQTAINDAVTAGASATVPWTIVVYPGTYNESLTFYPGINLVGVGPKGVCVVYQLDATLVDYSLCTSGKNEIENLTFELGTPTVARDLFTDGGKNVAQVTYTDVQVLIDTPGTFSHNVFAISGTSYFDMLNLDCHPAGSGASNIFNVSGASAHVEIEHCDLNNNSTSASCATVLCSGAGALVEIDNSDIFAPYGDSAVCSDGIVIFRETHYHSINRSGTGNILDHSEYIQQYIWHMFTMAWDITTGSANITRSVGSGGATSDGGTGQLTLSCAASTADFAYIANNSDATGALASTFNPERTPRNCVQFSSSGFIADSYMFFGLRTTLSATLPTTESHFGFQWDGTNFITSNADGVTQKTNVLTTPTTGAQHQLDIIVYGSVKIEYYVDGKIVATETSNLPTGELTWQKLLFNDATTAPLATVYVTLRRMSCHECPM